MFHPKLFVLIAMAICLTQACAPSEPEEPVNCGCGKPPCRSCRCVKTCGCGSRPCQGPCCSCGCSK
ncbi:keratin-associated protein 5-8 [Drosophila obscura]|uniref:keratin-associated protein 5-8 n=1 Tax=Drosophila obscura TaxID=7282 RepID=UPI000BA17D72|nr:keratin-associated protein 5-8 [Drosophila obscura]